MIEDRVIVAFKQGSKDEKTIEKLATKTLKRWLNSTRSSRQQLRQLMPEPKCMDKLTPPE